MRRTSVSVRHLLSDTKGIFCCDTRYHSLVLDTTYSYVHPHEITVGKTVGIPHENRGSSPLWATAYSRPRTENRKNKKRWQLAAAFIISTSSSRRSIIF
jgi:hypothetical protein